MPAKPVEKLSAKDLKTELKSRKMVQSGDKPTLVTRLKCAQACEDLGLKTDEGQYPYELNFPGLKRVASGCGVSPMGSQDEVLIAYVDYLKSNSTPGGGTAKANDSMGSAGKSSNDAKDDPSAVMKRLLSLAEVDDYIGIINIAAGGKATASSPASVLRKHYLKLSLVIHPDKNPGNPDATKAFQALVKAFERLTEPQMEAEPTAAEAKKREKTTKIARSNDGCKRTTLCCPRCKEKWSERGLEGNPDYFYNLMMQGLKTFHCSTCLLEFGCMTAIHKCPWCKKQFEYSPQDYHRQIECGNKGCSNKFGFYEYPISERALKDLRQTIRQEQEGRMKQSEAKRRRAGRSTATTSKEDEAAFVMGISDACPRCGEELEEYSDEDARKHLRDCDDSTGKITAHKKKKQEASAKEEQKQKAMSVQEDYSSAAAWKFLGGETEKIWMLTDEAVKSECKSLGINHEGLSKDDMIGQIAAAKQANDGQLLLCDASAGKSALVVHQTKQKPVRRKLSVDSLPANYHSLPFNVLKTVCVAHGFTPKASTKGALLDEIEAEFLGKEVMGDKPATALLTDKSKRKPKKKRKIAEFEEDEELEAVVSDSEDDWQPED